MRRLLLALAAAFATGPASSETCLLAFEGTVVLQGPCHFETRPGGSFTVYDARGWQRGADGAWRITNAPTAFAAQLDIEARGVGRGFANLDRDASDPRRLRPSARLHADLGTMLRHEACWLSEQSALCAWE